jgi:hypothetical protein
MQRASTFIDAGWDFAGEIANGTEDIWGIDERRDYPRFTWGFEALPCDGAIDVILSPILRWVPGEPDLRYDVYFGGDEQAVANATPQTPGIYRGRQPPEMTTYEPGCLKGGKTYYWRIDGVDEGDPNSLGSTDPSRAGSRELAEVWKGSVWSFRTVEFVLVSVLDDFESYTYDIYVAGPFLPQTWISGLVDHRTGSVAGPFAERTIIHGGKKSMPMDYYNVTEPWYSQAERTWETPQDWTTNHADTLTLYF